MASENEENMIVGLDIGTSKIVAIVGSVRPAWRARDYGYRNVSILGS